MNLRCVRAGDLDLVRRIYVAVRDSAWNVIPPRVRITELTIADDWFDVRFRARHREGALDFAWDGSISGSRDGRIRYALDGTARASFAYNKIGILVVHPVATHAERPLTASGGPTGPFVGTFPRLVGPQAIRDGRLHGLFPPFRSLEIDLQGGILDLDFEGADFEMEDERNWTESGFKTYSGTVASPWPMEAQRGMAVRQAVTLDYRDSSRSSRRPRPIRPALTVGGPSAMRPPLIGHTVPEAGPPPTPAEASLLRLARPSFIHADLRFDDQDADHLERVSSTLAATDRPLLASLYLGDDAARDIDRFIQWRAAEAVSLETIVLITRQAASSFGVATSQETVEVVLPRLRAALPGVPVAVGSDRSLAEVIRSTPTTHGADTIAFGICPSGHAEEDWALIENLPAQGDAVRTLRGHLGPTPIIGGPVTLQTRFGSWPHAPYRSGELPPQVDVRQRSLLAAAWTLGSVRELTLTGVALAIYYETMGWRGLLEREAGNPMPTRFRSVPLEVFPIHHVLADIGETLGAPMLDTELEGGVTGLCFGKDRPDTILLANLSPTPASIRVGPLPGRRVQARILDGHSLGAARRAPQRFRERNRTLDVQRGVASLELGPYTYARIDVPAATGGRGRDR